MRRAILFMLLLMTLSQSGYAENVVMLPACDQKIEDRCQALIDKGMHELSKSRKENALSFFSSACSVDSRNPLALLSLASCYSLLSKWTQSLEQFDKLIALDDSDYCAEAHYRKSIVLQKLNRISSAIDECKLASDLNPGLGKTRFLGHLYMQNGQPNEAIEQFVVVAKEEPDATVWQNLEQCYKQIGNEEDAKKAHLKFEEFTK